MSSIILVLVIALFVSGTSLMVIFGVPALLGAYAATGSLELVKEQIFGSIVQSELIALPMFILLGNIIAKSGSGDAMLALCVTVFSRFRHSLVFATVAGAVFFAGTVGAAAAEAAVLATVLARPMKRFGYPESFTLGLIAAASVLGIIIPPSTPMIIYSALAHVSLNDMFLAGIFPGLVLALVILACALLLAWRGGYGPSKDERPTARSISNMSAGRLLQTALPVSFIPLIIVASIYLGWATPTESASVALIYALAVTTLQRRLTGPIFIEAVMESVRVVSAIAILIAVTQMFAFVITFYRWPQELTEQIIAIGMSAIVFLMVTNVLLIILGIPLEPAPLLFIIVPVVAPVIPALGINPVHFGIIVIVNLGLAIISPPVGLVLFTLASVTGTKSEQVFRAVLPFCGVILIGLLIITYLPSLSLFFKK